MDFLSVAEAGGPFGSVDNRNEQPLEDNEITIKLQNVFKVGSKEQPSPVIMI